MPDEFIETTTALEEPPTRLDDRPQVDRNKEASAQQTPYDEYRDKGGIFGEKIFNTLISLPPEQLEARQAELPIISQVSSIARRANVPLTPQEVKWYQYLRKSPSTDEDSDGTDPARIGDQKILAEVFRMEGNMEKYSKLATAFPHIFGNPEEEHEK